MRLDERLEALKRRGLERPAPVVVADRWFGYSKLMMPVRLQHQGTLWVEGKGSYRFALPDGSQVKGHDLLTRSDWPWRDSPWKPRVRYARLSATSPTYGRVTLVIVDEPGQDRLDVMCLATSITALQLIRRWRRRSWIEPCFRTLKHLLATEACQMQREDAYYGPLVLRLRGCFVLCYTARVVCNGRVTREEIVVSLKHD